MYTRCLTCMFLSTAAEHGHEPRPQPRHGRSKHHQSRRGPDPRGRGHGPGLQPRNDSRHAERSNGNVPTYVQLSRFLREASSLAVSTAAFCCDFCCGVFRLGLSRRSFHVIGTIYFTRLSHTDNIDLIKLTPGKLNEGGSIFCIDI